MIWPPPCWIFIPAIGGTAETCASSNLSESSGLLKSIRNGIPGVHWLPQPHSESMIFSGG